LDIDHPEKQKFDYLLPLFIGLFLSLPLLSHQFREDVIGDKLGVMAAIANVLGVLAGFFIASLAAVATFGKTEMDAPMPGEPPVRLEHRTSREKYFENLTRRRFLSFLFGYLAFLSLALCVFSYSYFIADRYLFSWLYPDGRHFALGVFWVAFMLCVANMLSNTFLGLYYLTDRIHRPNKVLHWGEPDSASTADKTKL
jgi:hypothetical protein